MTTPSTFKTPDAAITLTEFGFKFGDLDVSRVCAIPDGGAIVRLATSQQDLMVRVTATGRLIITNNKDEVLRFVHKDRQQDNPSPAPTAAQRIK